MNQARVANRVKQIKEQTNKNNSLESYQSIFRASTKQQNYAKSVHTSFKCQG